MHLFSKKQPAPAPEITYDEVVDYLRCLEQRDYTNILKVVKIYRDADKGVKKVLNIKDVPTDVNHLEPASQLDDDTELGNFLDDDHDTPASKKQRQTAQKATNVAKKIKVK